MFTQQIPFPKAFERTTNTARDRPIRFTRLVLRTTDKRGPMLPVGVMPRICCHPRHSPYIYGYGSHTSLIPDLLYTD